MRRLLLSTDKVRGCDVLVCWGCTASRGRGWTLGCQGSGVIFRWRTVVHVLSWWGMVMVNSAAKRMGGGFVLSLGTRSETFSLLTWMRFRLLKIEQILSAGVRIPDQFHALHTYFCTWIAHWFVAKSIYQHSEICLWCLFSTLTSRMLSDALPRTRQFVPIKKKKKRNVEREAFASNWSRMAEVYWVVISMRQQASLEQGSRSGELFLRMRFKVSRGSRSEELCLRVRFKVSRVVS